MSNKQRKMVKKPSASVNLPQTLSKAAADGAQFTIQEPTLFLRKRTGGLLFPKNTKPLEKSDHDLLLESTAPANQATQESTKSDHDVLVASSTPSNHTTQESTSSQFSTVKLSEPKISNKLITSQKKVIKKLRSKSPLKSKTVTLPQILSEGADAKQLSTQETTTLLLRKRTGVLSFSKQSQHFETSDHLLHASMMPPNNVTQPALQANTDLPVLSQNEILHATENTITEENTAVEEETPQDVEKMHSSNYEKSTPQKTDIFISSLPRSKSPNSLYTSNYETSDIQETEEESYDANSIEALSVEPRHTGFQVVGTQSATASVSVGPETLQKTVSDLTIQETFRQILFLCRIR